MSYKNRIDKDIEKCGNCRNCFKPFEEGDELKDKLVCLSHKEFGEIVKTGICDDYKVEDDIELGDWDDREMVKWMKYKAIYNNNEYQDKMLLNKVREDAVKSENTDNIFLLPETDMDSAQARWLREKLMTLAVALQEKRIKPTKNWSDPNLFTGAGLPTLVHKKMEPETRAKIVVPPSTPDGKNMFDDIWGDIVKNSDVEFKDKVIGIDSAGAGESGVWVGFGGGLCGYAPPGGEPYLYMEKEEPDDNNGEKDES